MQYTHTTLAVKMTILRRKIVIFFLSLLIQTMFKSRNKNDELPLQTQVLLNKKGFKGDLSYMKFCMMCFLIDTDPELFEAMGKSKRGDWLAEHKESGQTHRQYSNSGTLNS